MANGSARRITCPNCGSEILTFSDDVSEESLLERHRGSGRCPGAGQPDFGAVSEVGAGLAAS